MTESAPAQLAWCLHRVAQLQGARLDAVAIDTLMHELSEVDVRTWEGWERFCAVAGELGFSRPLPAEAGDDARFPLLAFNGEVSGWAVVTARSAGGEWELESRRDGAVVRRRRSNLEGVVLLHLGVVTSAAPGVGEARAFKLIRRAFAGHWGAVGEGALATIVGNVLALGTAFFSMQVYDRVIPTRSSWTLWSSSNRDGLRAEAFLHLSRPHGPP